MKKILFAVIALMAITAGTLEMLYANPLRLHILANSDAPEDQQVKLLVRDAILEKTSKDFQLALSEADAEASAEVNLEEILQTANEVLEEHGFSYRASAELGSFEFPERTYAERTYPAGEYRALRVTLGAGEGHNWWCVLYPPLCTTNFTEKDVEIRSYLAEWLKGIFT